MPRPGPRPYECVRRAWHSDRHQPMRGSLIQEIFRLVSEVHCSATRKNREWQEKLPIVVLKAEEIMYSKANSEAEYSNLKTLWDRVTDAINTIIRRDESTETDQKFLQPCIEAALQLGCTPRRSSRSQRNESPRCYLHPENLGNTSVPNNNSISKLYHNHKTISPLMLHCPQLSTLDTMNPLNSCSKGYYNNNFQNRAPDWTKKFAVLPNNFVPSDNHHHVSAQACPSSTTWSAYPLYYNNQIQPDGSNIRSSKPSNSSSRLDASEFVFPFSHENGSSKVQEVECDLTLRLGTLAAPRGGIETSWPSQVDNGDRFKFKSHLNK